MKLVTLLLPEAYVKELNELVEMGMYPSRSAAIRFAVMDLLKRELWQEREAKEAVKEKVVMTRKGIRVTRKSGMKRRMST